VDALHLLRDAVEREVAGDHVPVERDEVVAEEVRREERADVAEDDVEVGDADVVVARRVVLEDAPEGRTEVAELVRPEERDLAPELLRGEGAELPGGHGGVADVLGARRRREVVAEEEPSGSSGTSRGGARSTPATDRSTATA
jgi:hypothetical protein